MAQQPVGYVLLGQGLVLGRQAGQGHPGRVRLKDLPEHLLHQLRVRHLERRDMFITQGSVHHRTNHGLCTTKGRVDVGVAPNTRAEVGVAPNTNTA